MTERQDIGEKGEALAVQFLIQKGHIILDQNWRAGKDELDIISEFGDLLIVTEVKTRTSKHHMLPEQAVDERKQRCILRAAETYVHEKNMDIELRFDIISVVLKRNDYELFHIEDAFYATL